MAFLPLPAICRPYVCSNGCLMSLFLHWMPAVLTFTTASSSAASLLCRMPAWCPSPFTAHAINPRCAASAATSTGALRPHSYPFPSFPSTPCSLCGHQHRRAEPARHSGQRHSQRGIRDQPAAVSGGSRAAPGVVQELHTGRGQQAVPGLAALAQALRSLQRVGLRYRPAALTNHSVLDCRLRQDSLFGLSLTPRLEPVK